VAAEVNLSKLSLLASMKSKQPVAGKNARRRGKTRNPNLVSVSHRPFFDTDTSTSVTTTALQYSLLYNLCAANGLLQAFPQHASPFVTGSVNGLRQRLYLSHIEFRYQVIGAQSNVITTADMYNTVRIAIVRTGVNYSAVNPLYLSSTIVGSSLNSIQQVYLDRTYSLPSLAFTTANYNSPGVINGYVRIPINRYIVCHSGNSTGSGVAWDTEQQDYVINFVSDSSLTPHPTLTYSARFFFDYCDDRRRGF
jgi:hypothetical protein